MEYSPRNNIPYISRTDAGTIEVIRESGVEVVSSGDLIQRFEATWDDEQWAMHREAERFTTAAYDLAWDFIKRKVQAEGGTSEYEVQCLIMDHFRKNGLTTYSPPIVAVNGHGGDPHFETTRERDTPIREGDHRPARPVGQDGPAPVGLQRPDARGVRRRRACRPSTRTIFAVVAKARDAAIARVKEAYAQGRALRGWEVDDAARAVIEAAGHGERFVHRTGHNIGQEVHGNGANMDNLETREERLVMRRTCFSIEPGIYLRGLRRPQRGECLHRRGRPRPRDGRAGAGEGRRDPGLSTVLLVPTPGCRWIIRANDILPAFRRSRGPA